jgi:probable F420-dependent oxidoreductase
VKVDLMVSAGSWAEVAGLAEAAERAGLSGLVFTETSETPWMKLAAAATATSRLELSSGIAVAFARSPMVTACLAWELAGNSKGRFRIGVGSQVKAHVERRYGATYEPPGPRMRDYLEALKACFRAFRRDGPLDHHGRFYDLTLLPDAWSPSGHDYGEIKVDVAAVGSWMCRMAGAVADGVHVHPLHSASYLERRLLPSVAEGAALAGRDPSELEIIVPVFAVAGDSPEQRAPLLERARSQVAFYGSTRNYAFQFEDLGYPGTSARLNEALRAGDRAAMAEIVTDEILDHFVLVAPWAEMADALRSRYGGVASRVVLYLAEEQISSDPSALERWGEVARALGST